MKLVLVGLVALVGLAGCGGNDKGPGIASAGGPSDTSSSAPSGDQEERSRQFTSCLREHGLDVSDGDSKDGLKGVLTQVDKQKLSEAMAACQRYLPDGGKPEALTEGQIEAQREHAKCMREHGVPDWPDPGSDSGATLDKSSPVLRKALDECADKLARPDVVDGPGVNG